MSDHTAEQQELSLAAELLLKSARRKESEDLKRQRLRAELAALIATPLIASPRGEHGSREHRK